MESDVELYLRAMKQFAVGGIDAIAKMRDEDPEVRRRSPVEPKPKRGAKVVPIRGEA